MFGYKYDRLATDISDHIWKIMCVESDGHRQAVRELVITLPRKVRRPRLLDLDVHCVIRRHDVGMLKFKKYHEVLNSVLEGLAEVKTDFKDPTIKFVELKLVERDRSCDEQSFAYYTTPRIAKVRHVEMPK